MISFWFVFTDANTIQKVVNNIVGTELPFGPALCSETVIDIKIPGDRAVEKPYFIHTLGGLGGIQWGGYDSSNLRIWNNAK